MKKLKSWMLLIIMFGIISCNQSANSTKDQKEISDTGTAERDVASAVDSFNNLIVNPDKVLLGKLTAEALTYGHSSGLIQNKEELIDDLVNGDFDFSSVNAQDQTIYIVGETAIVRHIFSAKAKNAGESVDIRIGNILVFQEQEGEWKLLARQAFKLL